MKVSKLTKLLALSLFLRVKISSKMVQSSPRKESSTIFSKNVNFWGTEKTNIFPRGTYSFGASCTAKMTPWARQSSSTTCCKTQVWTALLFWTKTSLLSSLWWLIYRLKSWIVMRYLFPNLRHLNITRSILKLWIQSRMISLRCSSIKYLTMKARSQGNNMKNRFLRNQINGSSMLPKSDRLFNQGWNNNWNEGIK